MRRTFNIFIPRRCNDTEKPDGPAPLTHIVALMDNKQGHHSLGLLITTQDYSSE